MPVNLTANAITAINNGDINAKPIVQVLKINFNDTNQCYSLVISDGLFSQDAMLAFQLHERVTTGQVIAGSVVQLTDYFCQDRTSRKIIVVVNMETIIPECEIIGNPKWIPQPESAGQKQRIKLKVSFRKKQEEEGQEEEERKKQEEEEEREKQEEEEREKQEEEEWRKKQEEEVLEIVEVLEALLEEQKMEVMEMLGMVDEERKQEQEEQRMKEEEEKESAEDWILETLSELYQSRCQICLNAVGGDNCVQCGRCEGWVHICCAGVIMDMPAFICPRCKNMPVLF